MKAVLLFSVLAGLAASPEPQYFQYIRPLTAPPVSSRDSCAALPPGIFAHAAPGLADLRLYRGGTEIPFALRSADMPPSTPTNAELLNVGTIGEDLVVDLHVNSVSYGGLRLLIDQQNFVATVDVFEGRSPGSFPIALGTHTIFNFTRERLGRSIAVDLGKADLPYLHLRLHGPIAPARLNGVELTSNPTAGKDHFDDVVVSTTFTMKDRATIAQLTVPPRTPIDRVRFDLPTTPPALARHTTVTVEPAAGIIPPADEQEPRIVSFGGELLRVNRMVGGELIDREETAIAAGQSPAPYATKWTVKIENGDDAPLLPTRVRLQMSQRLFCFSSTAGATYNIAYGDPDLEAAHYDYAETLGAASPPVSFVIGPEQTNPAYKPRPDTRAFTERHPAVLWIALLATIAVLGVVALRSTAKRTV